MPVLFTMASTEGFEPATLRLEGACSIQLSYVDKRLNNNSKYSQHFQGGAKRLDYYDKTRQTIKELLEAGKEAEAGRIIEEELGLPYIPLPFESELKELKQSLRKAEEQHLISDQQQLRLLLNGDIEQQLAALNSLRHLNCRNYDLLLHEFFQSAPNPQVAGLLIDILIAQSINQEFKYKRGKEVLVFKACDLSHPYEVSAFHDCYNELCRLLADNYPIELQMAEDLLLYYSYVILPKTIKDEDSRLLAQAVVYQVFITLGNSEILPSVIEDVALIEKLCENRFSDLRS